MNLHVFAEAGYQVLTTKRVELRQESMSLIKWALRRNPTTYPKGQLSERSGLRLAWEGEGTRLDEGSWMAWI